MGVSVCVCEIPSNILKHYIIYKYKYKTKQEKEKNGKRERERGGSRFTS